MAMPTERSMALVVRPFRSQRAMLSAVAVLLIVFFLFLFRSSDDYSLSLPQFLPGSQSNIAEEDSLERPPKPTAGSSSSVALSSAAELDAINSTLQYFRDYPITPPYKDVFGHLGQRTQILRSWMAVADSKERGSAEHRQLLEIVDTTAQALFPFLSAPPRNRASLTPFADLRATFQPGSKGVVIPAGGKMPWRFACHLVGALRKVHGSTLPILIVYAGEEDLPAAKREALAAVDEVKNGGGVEFLDITTVFDDKLIGLINGGWAIKPFAALAAPFEHVALLDADAVMMQSPERLFAQQAYIDMGALLFHDRLLWQHAFKERHEWWHSQVKHESPSLAKSLVWTEEYAEEGDSGVVVFDKSRLDILTGMLHICWQNTRDVREEITYKITYGDKESYWFGLELSGATYSFENHYGAMVGWPQEEGKKVCSFAIAHTDEKDALLWYNGSLLKNKLIDETFFDAPTKWMLDGTWEKGATKPDMSCMVDAEVRDVTKEEAEVLEKSIEVAKDMDRVLDLL